jgi:hypothetical protein
MKEKMGRRRWNAVRQRLSVLSDSVKVQPLDGRLQRNVAAIVVEYLGHSAAPSQIWASGFRAPGSSCKAPAAGRS